MTIRTRRILACAGAILLLAVSAVPLFIGGLSLWSLADRLFPPGVPGQNLNTSRRDLYLSLSFLGLGLATVLSVVYCTWYRRPTKKSVVVAYFVFLITLTSMSASNFAMGDALLNRKAQALIDLVLVILGLVVVVELLKMSPSSVPGQVLRGVIVFLVILQGLALPGIYGLLWLLNWQNAISAGQSKDLNPGWISGAAGGVSAVVAILNYRVTQRMSRDKDDEKKLIL